MEKLFYVENRERGVVGNCLLFWRKSDSGYTCNLNDSKKFTYSEAIVLVEGRKKYRMWECEAMDAMSQRHVDIQDINRLIDDESERVF